MALTKKQRAELKMKFGGHCAYCGELLGDKWHADHFEPVVRDFKWEKCSKKGCLVAKQTGELLKPENDTMDNMMPACIRCNLNKSSIPLEGWRNILSNYINGLNNHGKYAMYQHAKRFGLVQETNQPVVFFFEKWDGKHASE